MHAPDLIRHRAARLTALLGVAHPIIGGPMAGVTTPALAAAVSNAGGLGALGVGMLEPEAIESTIAQTRALTSLPFAVNLFVTPQPAVNNEQLTRMIGRLVRYRGELGLPRAKIPSVFAPDFAAQFDAVLAARVPVVSFTFGALDAPRIDALHAQGATVIGTATCVREAKQLAASGCDAIVASGIEAGGHRATFAVPFEASQVGLFALLPQVAAAVDIPVIAAGGVMTAQQIAAALLLGASGVQLGSALLRTPESGASAAYKGALVDVEDIGTRQTRAFSGRPARGVINRMMVELATVEADIPPYPIQNKLTQELRAAANTQGRAEFMSLWAGQAVGLARAEPAGEIVRRLAGELESLLQT
ncbi:MAG: nitronate monooxygenase family protein [Burkholderiaceae bacterium]|nr:nitronate monooxygenase family protein [Burkholderiaceae bacterium]